MSTQTPARRPAQQQARQPVMPLVPFLGGAHEHSEPVCDVTFTPGASSSLLGVFDVPSYGFMRHLYVQVEASGGTLGAGSFAADAPWSALQEIALLDVNGGPIFGPYTGFNAFMANLHGGYAGRSDLVNANPNYSVATANFVYAFRVPVEISHHDGRGSLPNQNSSATYKLRLTGAPSASIFAVAPTTVPAVRVRVWLEAWSQPSATDLAGRPQEVAPPGMGTTQFWTNYQRSVSAGQNTIPIPRVGNLIRTLIVICRDAGGARVANASLPDPIELRWDARQLLIEPRLMRLHKMAESMDGPVTLPIGHYAFTFDRTIRGMIGDGSPALFLPTVQSTRLELVGSNWPAGTVEILVNDVAPVEVAPDARYVETSATGFRPAGGAPVI